MKKHLLYVIAALVVGAGSYATTTSMAKPQKPRASFFECGNPGLPPCH